MRTNRRKNGFVGLFGILSLMLATLASVGQPAQAKAAGACVAPTYEMTGGDSGAQMRVVSFASDTCLIITMSPNEVALVGAFHNRLEDREDGQPGQVELHKVDSSLKALKWNAPFYGYLSYGQVRLIDASRAQCEFEKWRDAEQNFTSNFPLDGWAGQKAVCGPIDGGGTTSTFAVDAPAVLPPGVEATIKVGSDPAGEQALLSVAGGVPVLVTTPFTGTFNVPAGQKSPWVLKDQGGNQLANGEIDVMPTRACYNLPDAKTWNTEPGAALFGFSTDEDKTGANVLRVCGTLPQGVVMLIGGEVVGNEAYGVLTSIIGPGAMDVYVRNAGVSAFQGCGLAQAEFAKQKAAGGANLTIFHEPTFGPCTSRAFLPLLHR